MTAFTVTVLGNSSGGVPPAGGAGSGYLVACGEARVLVDCGNGVLGHLRRHVASFNDLDAVYLTHLHADHVGDLIALALQYRYARRRVPLYGPPGLRTLLYRWFSLFHGVPEDYVEAWELHELKPWDTVTVKDLRFQACPVEHNVPCFGFRAEPVAGGARLFYSGDTKAGGLVTEAAHAADLFLAEATFQDLVEGRAPEKAREHHMTAREAGAVAARAGAKRLLLTHFLHTLDPARSVAEAREAFDGPVEAAEPGRTYPVAAASASTSA